MNFRKICLSEGIGTLRAGRHIDAAQWPWWLSRILRDARSNAPYFPGESRIKRESRGGEKVPLERRTGRACYRPLERELRAGRISDPPVDSLNIRRPRKGRRGPEKDALPQPRPLFWPLPFSVHPHRHLDTVSCASPARRLQILAAPGAHNHPRAQPSLLFGEVACAATISRPCLQSVDLLHVDFLQDRNAFRLHGFEGLRCCVGRHSL